MTPTTLAYGPVKRPGAILATTVLATAASLGIATSQAEGAPAVAHLGPALGQVGHVVILEGTDLGGSDIQVMFGGARGIGAANPGVSDRVIHVRVPNKIDPRDPDTVTVGVVVDGVAASAPGGSLQFTYALPQPGPEITDFTTDDPASPKAVYVNRPFVLTLFGSDFLTLHRAPERCIAVGGEEMVSEVLTGPPGDTSVRFAFPGLAVPGDYVFLLAFSDGSSAGIEAPGFVLRPPLFGFPPTIESVSITTIMGQSVQCDFTRILENYLCDLGFIEALAQPGVFMGGTHSQIMMQVKATDPDSTPTHDDVMFVGATFINPDTQAEATFVLFDDGSANVFRIPQRSTIPEDCSDALPEFCACRAQDYDVVSGDVAAHDSIFTRDLVFVDRATPSLALLQDCLMLQNRALPQDFVAGSILEFQLDAVDRSGNIATWPLRPQATIGTGAIECTGDACGCCLLTSSNPRVECAGLQGMPSTDFPDGICTTAF